MDEWPLPETRETYTVQFRGASWVQGGEGQYEGFSLEVAQEEVAGIKQHAPQVQTRIVKAVTTYEHVVLV